MAPFSVFVWFSKDVTPIVKTFESAASYPDIFASLLEGQGTWWFDTIVSNCILGIFFNGRLSSSYY